MHYTREVTAIGPRSFGTAGHDRLQAYFRSRLKGDNVEEDFFQANTPAGKFEGRNFIAKYPGTKEGIIIIAGHYDTKYGIKNFVGANDGGASTGLLLEFANHFRAQTKAGPRPGYSVWLVWFDGEEAVRDWTATDSLYGSRHLAQKLRAAGMLMKIKAFFLVDMIGDADLNIDKESYSTSWLQDLVYKAASKLGHQSYFFGRSLEIEDDHLPFVQMGVPSVDLIDLDYGPGNSYHHTTKDTIDKVSAKSLGIAGDVVIGTVALLEK